MFNSLPIMPTVLARFSFVLVARSRSATRWTLAGACGWMFLTAMMHPAVTHAQRTDGRPSSNRAQQIRGKRPSTGQKFVVLKGRIDQSTNPEKFQVDLKTIKTTLNQRVDLPRAPFPKDWDRYSAENKVKWIEAFQTSPRGKVFLARNKKKIDEAPAFNLRFNDDGEFIVYDVPPGVYGLQGRVDKEINGVKYAFEVFGQIQVNGQFDEVALDPIPVLATPQLESGQKAPEINVATHNGKRQLGFKNLQVKKGEPDPKYVFLNFWSSKDYVAKGKPDYQQTVQDAIGELEKEGYKIGLLSICLDENLEGGIQHIMKNKFSIGLHGFTKGWEHETVDRYGVRSTPSGWLLDPKGKIVMSQYEFYNLTKIKASLTEMLRDRIDGKDAPTPATATQ